MSNLYPIIYIRGYAMTAGEIADTVATPYMGFEQGATKIRQTWDQKVVKHVFESPLIRLMKDYGYRDVYSNGQVIEGPIPAKSIVIYRYYDGADEDIGTGKVASIVEAAAGLRDLIHDVRKQVCDSGAMEPKDFKVHLVAHSMGGLIVRAFLQNGEISSAEDRALVDKVFTYATPHNGIEMAGFNVPSVFGLWDMNNFNRKKMAEYLALPQDSQRVDSLNGKFDPARFFCLVGTNHRDYAVAAGLSRRLAGEMSDGLVKIENATVEKAPRAFVFRSHSGPYGIVNSEEGYQNLVRFLFGNVRVEGSLVIEEVPLPPSVEKEKKQGKQVRGSYYFEATVAPRGAYTYRLTERRRDTFSAILRTYDEIRPGEDAPRSPTLFSTFLDTRKITVGTSIVFGLDLQVSSTGYEVGSFLSKQHLDGEYLFRDTITIKATRTAERFNIHYLFTDENWSEAKGKAAQQLTDGTFMIPIASKKGFQAKLLLNASTWN
jgi:hypothetical protein